MPKYKRTKDRVLLLASYCDPKDNPDCTDALPCEECLKMCNVADAEGDYEINVHGGYDYLRETGHECKES